MLNVNKSKTIGIIGLGYVGLPLAIEFGKLRNVIGYDLNLNRVNELKKGIDNTREVSNKALQDAKYLQFSTKESHLEDCEIFIVTVPTPIDSVNRPHLKPLKNATKTIAEYIKKGSIVIFESTVYPGCTEEVCVPILEQISGLKYNVDFFCGYSPERVNPGDKVNTVSKIIKIVSGSNESALNEINELYNEIITAGTFKASSIKVAEAAKVIENTQRDLNIALVNELSLIFEKLDIDTIEVLEAAGTKWNFLPFRPGMVGGHCIGVDPYYLTHKAEEIGYHPEVILAGRRINDFMSNHAAKSIIQKMINNQIDISRSSVGVLGITFKENCPDIRNTKVIDLIEELKSWSVNVQVCDPWANPEEVRAEYAVDLVEIEDLQNLDSIVVAVGHNEFRDLNVSKLRSFCSNQNPILADLKSIYNKEEINHHGFTLFRL